MGIMSKVISFRLNPTNPREAKALNILQGRLSRGFSTRHTLTEAILNLDSTDSKAPDIGVLTDLSQQVKELLANIETGLFLDVERNDISSKEELSEGFVSSIFNSAKTGMGHDV